MPHIARFGPALGVYAAPSAMGVALLCAEEQAQDCGSQRGVAFQTP